MHDHATKTYATLQHDEHPPQKKATPTSKTYGALQHGKRSQHQKKATLTKGAHLLKCIAAFCVLNSAGATAVSSSAHAPSPSPPSTCECSAELEVTRREQAKLEAKLEAVL
eukprot:scaffold7427_cov74-Phaeocystis_antarctica.AAC.1